MASIIPCKDATFIYDGKRFTEQEFKAHLKSLDLKTASQFVDGLTAVPEMPFAKNWHELAVKRILRHAAEQGYDRVAFTTGEQQAERYDLSKHLDSIRIGAISGDDSLVAVRGYKDGKEVLFKRTPKNSLDEVVGKDLANKYLSSGSEQETYSGLDLKVGGEGMRGFYDQILPSFLNKYAKKWGARVGEAEVPITPRDFDSFAEQHRRAYPEATDAQIVAAHKRFTENYRVHAIDVTPQMKASVLSEGQPLFQGEKGAVQFLKDGRAIIHAFESADISTAVHEMAHVFRRDLTPELLSHAEKWAGVENGKWSESAEEKFARGFERYLKEGKAPSVQLRQVFEQFKEYLTNIYGAIRGKSHELNVKLTPEIVKVWDTVLGAPKGEHGKFNSLLYKAPSEDGTAFFAHPKVRQALDLKPIPAEATSAEVSRAMTETSDALTRKLGNTRASENTPEAVTAWARKNVGGEVVPSLRVAQQGAAVARGEVDQPAEVAQGGKWLEGLGDAREGVLAEMRAIRAESDRSSEEMRRMRPSAGSIAAGAGEFDPFVRGESQATFLRELGKGATPAEAEAAAKKFAREAVALHNAKRPKDVNWARSEITADSTIERTRRRIEDAAKVQGDQLEASHPTDRFIEQNADKIAALYDGTLSEARFLSGAKRSGISEAEARAIVADARASRRAGEGSGAQGEGAGAEGVADRVPTADRPVRPSADVVPPEGDASVLYQSAPKARGVKRIGEPEKPEGAKVPRVDFDLGDLQDGRERVNAKTILEDYKGKGADPARYDVYKTYVHLADIPDAKLAGGRDAYDWSELRDMRGRDIPPVKLEVNSRGNLKIIDGNHRLEHWREQGYDYAPAWVIHDRRAASGQPKPQGVSIFNYGGSRKLSAAENTQAAIDTYIRRNLAPYIDAEGNKIEGINGRELPYMAGNPEREARLAHARAEFERLRPNLEIKRDREGTVRFFKKPDSAPSVLYQSSSPTQRAREAAGRVRATETPEFKRWSGGAPVVGKGHAFKTGEPVVVEAHHGTSEQFDEFDPYASRYDGFFFSSEVEDARFHGERVVSAYIRLKNPLVQTSQGYDPTEWIDGTDHEAVSKAREQGRDGVIIKGTGEFKGAFLAVPFEPTQIKSVNNRGTFDPSDPNILYQSAPPPRRVSPEVEKMRQERARIQQGISGGERVVPPPTVPRSSARAPKVTPLEAPRKPTMLERVSDVANIPRTLKSSIDLSAAGRQGLKFVTTHPAKAVRIFFGDQMRSLRKSGYEDFKRKLASDPDRKRMEDAGLHLSSLADESRPTQREEAFASKIAAKVPLVGASERAYVAFLDSARSAWFKQLAAPDATPDQLKAVAKFVNRATGRGDLGKGAVNDALPLLNAVFFAPRYTVSRVQVFDPRMYAAMTPAARKTAIRQGVQHYATVVAALALAKYGAQNLGVTVATDDPTSADFGKIKSGDTRYDVTAGDTQYVNLAARIFRHFAEKGRKDDKTALDIIAKWARYKLAPLPAAVVNVDQGKDAVGRPTSVGREAIQLVAPMYLNDLYEAYREGGMKTVAKEAPGFLGVGVQTYGEKPKTALRPPRLPDPAKELKRELKRSLRP